MVWKATKTQRNAARALLGRIKWNVAMRCELSRIVVGEFEAGAGPVGEMWNETFITQMAAATAHHNTYTYKRCGVWHLFEWNNISMWTRICANVCVHIYVNMCMCVCAYS